MARRKRRRRRRHNQGGGRQPATRLLDTGREEHFKFYARKIINGDELAQTQDVHVDSMVQAIIAKGSRRGIPDAREYIKEQEEAANLSTDAGDDLRKLLDRYATMR